MSIYDSWQRNFNQGFAPNQPVQMKPAKFTTYNTPEDEKILQGGTSGGVVLKPSPLAKAVARCFHRDPNTKMFTTFPLNDGSGLYRCAHCGALMKNPDEITYQVAKEAFDEFKADWETIKALDINCTKEVADNFYILMAYLEPWPDMANYVIKEFDRCFVVPSGIRNDTYYAGAPGGFNTFDSIMGNRPMGNMYGNNAGVYPGYGGVPMSSTNMQAANMVAGGNPFATGYQQPVQQTQQPVQQQPIMYNNPYQQPVQQTQQQYQQYPGVTEIPPMLNNNQNSVAAPPAQTTQPAPVDNNNTGEKKTFSI